MGSYKNKERPLVSFDWTIKRLLCNKADFGIVNGFLSALFNRPINITHVPESESNKENERQTSIYKQSFIDHYKFN
ncbi:MAG: hypothetical protein LBI60_01045 [Bacteroidales bacterium]|jgi:hypothetical protein|nr:hypothetical protein [Bacteroidales bacterium]